MPSSGDPARGLRSEVEQRLDGPGGLFAGAQLQDLTEQDEGGDDGGGLEVDVDRAVHRGTRRGRCPGATVATTLNSQATPVPIAISVNMFSLRVRTDVQPRTKNGQPAHSTTGVARTSWIQRGRRRRR